MAEDSVCGRIYHLFCPLEPSRVGVAGVKKVMNPEIQKKISGKKWANTFFQVKRDYSIGRGYLGFILDGYQLVAITIAAISGLNLILVAAMGIMAITVIVLTGIIARKKGFIQRETGLITELNPQAMETLKIARKTYDIIKEWEDRENIQKNK